MYALAIDLGTTTLAASLIELDGGSRLAMTGSLNPQRSFGADVVSRLDAAVRSADSLKEMSGLIRTELLRLAHELCATTGITWNQVKQVAIAGNPAMQHILLGLPVASLAFPPYRPHYTGGTRLTAFDLGWEGSAGVYVFPMPGGFVGGDTVAFLYGQLEDQVKVEEEVKNQTAPTSVSSTSTSTFSSTLFLDMGTNGEMALMTGDTLWATSAAAGPAFEGGNLACGMAALPGAISSVRIKDERVRLQVIGNAPPAGICGSAAIEAITELLENHVIEAGGRLRDSAEIASNLANRIIVHQGENVFVLHRDARTLIYLSQGDIRQIQLAKSAIRAGMEVLAQRSRIQFQAVKNVILTGSFGAVLHPDWLKSIGIFDESMVHITRFTPEGALSGAEKALAAGDDFAAAEAVAGRFRVIPLSGMPLFEELFLRHIDFPH
ncbi:MAG: DUF4445 domain-containing protein [Desulfuromonadales bacterium]|nr:DUF4445 domain-containing protein [Desulfuromonadales bacterium]